MIVNKSYTFWNRAARAIGRRALHLISADSRKPAIITALTIAHLKTNFSLFIPFTMDSLPGVIPPRQRRQYCQHERPALRVRFILFSFCPPFLCSAPHRYNHSIASCQKNASGIRARAYNVIYKAAFFLCNFHKNRLRHRLLYCVDFTKIKNAQTFFFVTLLYKFCTRLYKFQFLPFVHFD